MHVRIDYQTTYRYARAARFIVQVLRLTPRSDDGQQVLNWRIETDVDARLRQHEDALGNIVHHLYTDRPTDHLTIRVTGEVITTDTLGILRGVKERLSPLVYLRETDLTKQDPAIVAFAEKHAKGPPIEAMHGLMSAIHNGVAFDAGATTATHTAAEVLKLGRGVCQDHAHLFVAAARAVGQPARYVSGHFVRSDGQYEQEAAHAWAEAFIEDLGWVGFDPANGVSPTDAYVRVATGLDYLGAAPVRGATYGGGGEQLAVKVNVRDIQSLQQRQQQAQKRTPQRLS